MDDSDLKEDNAEEMGKNSRGYPKQDSPIRMQYASRLTNSDAYTAF